MRPKGLISIFLLSSIFLMGVISVHASTSDYLPGGINYLDENNFHRDGTYYYETNNAFLIKPYTNYTLTIQETYAKLESGAVEIYFYDNSTCISSIYKATHEFLDYNQDYYYINFTTPSNCNYIEMIFEDDGSYFTNHGMSGMQLEEGDSFTTYEPFVAGSQVDTTAPYFASVNTVISYYDSPITIEEIKNSLTAFDAIDGDVSGSITLLNDGYTANHTVIGTYTCEFQVEDSAGNISNVSVEVEVVDILKPVFSDLGIIEAVYPNVYTTEDIMNMLSASDNYDGDISNQIVLVSENYTANSSVTGEYSMEFSVSDSSGNTGSYTQTIKVVDQEAPLIDGVENLSIGYDSTFTESDIFDLYTVTDNYDDASTLNLVIQSNAYSGNADKVGSYVVVLTVTDSNNNEGVKTLTVNVVDEIGPVIYMDFSIIKTYTDNVLALPDFVNILVNTNEIDNLENYSVTVDYDSYSDKAKTPGVYHLSLSLKDDLGNIIDKDFEVRVEERSADFVYEPTVPEQDVTGYTSKISTYIIGGILTLMLAASNIIWFIILKKRV